MDPIEIVFEIYGPFRPQGGRKWSSRAMWLGEVRDDLREMEVMERHRCLLQAGERFQLKITWNYLKGRAVPSLFVRMSLKRNKYLRMM
jgi:hypothetical protein